MPRTISALALTLCLLAADRGQARAQKELPPALSPAVRADGDKLLGDWEWRDGSSSVYLRLEPPVQRKDGRWGRYYLYVVFINKVSGRPPRRKGWYYGPADLLVNPKQRVLVPVDAEQMKTSRIPARLHYQWARDALDLTVKSGIWKGTYRLKKARPNG
jgi:hypothetical protein